MLREQRRAVPRDRQRDARAHGIVDAALVNGDSVITPAISVMSAIDGLVVVNPS